MPVRFSTLSEALDERTGADALVGPWAPESLFATLLRTGASHYLASERSDLSRQKEIVQRLETDFPVQPDELCRCIFPSGWDTGPVFLFRDSEEKDRAIENLIKSVQRFSTLVSRAADILTVAEELA